MTERKDPPGKPHGNERMSYWIDTTPSTSLPALSEDLSVDVAIVGGGIVGMTTAYLLAKQGKSVAVLERDRLALAETGHTTAHLQIVLDTRLEELVPRFGLDGAKKAWDSQLEAVRLIEQIARDERISCELTRLDAFLYGDKASDEKLLKEERRLAKKIGYEAEEADPAEMPFPARAAVRFPDQGKFHVRKYLLGLLEAAKRKGALFYEQTAVSDVEEGRKAKVKTLGGPTITADWVVHATNTPIWGTEVINACLDPYRTYAVGARVPKGVFPDALFWDTQDPYHYTRVEPKEDHDLVILGGEDHRVGAQHDTDKAWGALYQYLREATDEFTPVYQWSGEILETDDDLPYIGHLPARGENELAVTGDSGTGMTNGTLGALMVSERILGRGTPWDELYDAERAHQVARKGIGRVAHKGMRDVQRLIGRAVQRSEIQDIAELAKGQGAIVKQGLKPIAVARLPDGTLTACSGTCTHVGCTVNWNHGERSWDCPCHGSRFAPTGEVLHGPANKALEPFDVEELLEERERKVERRHP